MSRDLDRLRQEINEIDKNILQLISKRLRIAKEIGEIKSINKTPITDRERELEIKAKWIQLAKEYGIPETLIEKILEIILSYSKILQISPSEKKKVAIIGYGGMARAIASLLVIAGHNVIITGRSIEKANRLASEFRCVSSDIENAVKLSEYIILTLTPEALYDKIAEKVYSLAKGKVVMDITSSKTSIFDYLESKSVQYNFHFISTHPLFGPTLFPIGESIIIIPSRTSSNKKEEVIEFWRTSGLVPIVSSLEDHEKAMAIVQVLPHFYILGLRESLKQLSKEFNIDYEKYLTHNFRELMKIIDRIERIMPTIFEIQRMNIYAYKVREIGLSVLKKLSEELGEKS
jgi:chorismate mutase/prephenate dehydrogenase